MLLGFTRDMFLPAFLEFICEHYDSNSYGWKLSGRVSNRSRSKWHVWSGCVNADSKNMLLLFLWETVLSIGQWPHKSKKWWDYHKTLWWWMGTGSNYSEPFPSLHLFTLHDKRVLSSIDFHYSDLAQTTLSLI